MNEKGFVSLTIIIMLMVAILIGLFTMEHILMGNVLNDVRDKKIESEISSKNKIFLAAYDREYYDGILLKELNRKFRKNQYIDIFGDIIINGNDLNELEEISKVNYSYENIEKEINIISKSKMGKNIAVKEACFSAINPIFLYSINNYILNNEDLEYMNIDIDKIYHENYMNKKLDYVVFNGSKVVYLENDENDDIYITDDEKNYFPRNDIYLIIKDESKKSLLKIVETLEEYSILKINGIIYIDGDVYVGRDFNFNGVLMVNGNIQIDEKALVNLNGYLCCRSLNGDINYIYDRKILFGTYGTYIPNFFDLRLKSMGSV